MGDKANTFGPLSNALGFSPNVMYDKPASMVYNRGRIACMSRIIFSEQRRSLRQLKRYRTSYVSMERPRMLGMCHSVDMGAPEASQWEIVPLSCAALS